MRDKWNFLHHPHLTLNDDPQLRDEKTRKYTVNFHVTIVLKSKPRLTPFTNSTHYIYKIKITYREKLT